MSLLCAWDVRCLLIAARHLVWESWLVLVWENGNELSRISSSCTLSAVAMISLPGILSHECDFTLTQLPSLRAWQSKWSYSWCLHAERNWNMGLVEFCSVIQLPWSKSLEAAGWRVGNFVPAYILYFRGTQTCAVYKNKVMCPLWTPRFKRLT